ncbi:MAG: hemagglutinin repeat-containing protein [Gammaproteobacteria bacterium]|nr:hemagglutinin repeat-containing protein [Gammaproteobacteria bacterium]MBU0788066.1 hemagglutinin repeat-containing protein [Gammaproteobacteria bacterium]MBU0815436.1 hemagglutinin repeat-containing protein [Gammaproteobacteria bacterium]MBU1785456.1 hemagglutinin repeat-containing protein [Gammaproteobacteria bacterium]
MNKNQYRVIFNVRRGMRMAVAETAVSQGKCASGESCGTASTLADARQISFVLRAVSVGMLLLLQASLFSSVASAQVVADPGAQGNQKPTILQTASGVTQVNIQTPSAAGVSRNTYSQFDVQAQGVILNNSRTNVNTQLAGFVASNPWLTTDTARVILNEVNSVNPSHLNGYVEVAGQRAEVIVANPAGIAVNGGGFINASAVTLTTGTPVFNGGSLESYRVSGGNVSVNGAGLDTSTVDYTNILARATQINAGIWAKDLKIVTGINQIDATSAANSVVTGNAGTTTGAAPAFALDVAQLGGMYAGKITLVGTEAGLGVRNSGVIGATIGDVVVSQNGWLSNSGTLYAKGNASLNIQGDVTNTGDLSAENNIVLAATGTLENSSKLQARNALQANVQNLSNTASGEISAVTTRLVVADTLTNRGLLDGTNLAGTGQTQVDATTVNNIGTGRIYGDNISVAATTLNNDMETVDGTSTAATIAARDRLDVGVSTLNNMQGASILSLGDMAIGGSLDASRHVTGSADTVTNSASTLEAQGALSIHSAYINNLNPEIQWVSEAGTTGASGTAYFTTQGTLDSAQGATLSATSGSLSGMSHGGYGYYRVVGSEQETVCVEVGDGFSCNPTGNILPIYGYGKGYAQATSSSDAITFDGFASYTQTDYKAVVTKSTPGRIASGGDMTLVAGVELVNDQSVIVSGGALNITAPSIDNRARTITLNAVRSGTAYYWSQYDEGCGDLKGCSYNYQAYRPSAYQSTVASTQVLDTSVSKSNSTEVLSSQGTTLPTSTGASLPTSSLYRIQSSASASVLVETDPRFTNYKTWLGSDYITSQISLDPSVTQKRLGDGFYEQRLIREQVAELTGRRFLDNYTSDLQQYQALMDAGLTFANSFNLRPGIALSTAQIAQLTSDIVWLQQEDVTLADGTITQALVPHIYLAIKDGDLAPSGALLGGSTVALSSTGDVANSGTILGRQLVSIDANNINNLIGRIQAQNVVLNAAQDINNVGGSVFAQDLLAATAGRDINVASTTQSTSGQSGRYEYSQSGIDRVAGLYVTGPGVLVASAGNDINLVAAQIASAGSAQFQAGHDINLKTVERSVSNDFNAGNAANHLLSGQSTDLGSQISATGNVTLSAGNNVNAKAASIQAGGSGAGDLSISAGDQVNIVAGEQSTRYDMALKTSSSGWFSSTTTAQRDTNDTLTAVASNLGGTNVSIHSQQDLTVKASNVVADQNLSLVAANNINIEAGENRQTSSHFFQRTESGLLSGGGMGISIGEREQSLTNKTTSTTAAASTIGATAGNVTISAGKIYTQTGSDILTPGGDVSITAQKVDIVEARETSISQTEEKFSQSGLTLSMSNPVVSAMQAVQSTRQSANQASSGRMKTLAAASAVLAAYGGYTAINNGSGTKINGKENQIATGTDAAGRQTSRDATALDKVGGINVSISLGSSSSQNSSTVTGDAARGSSVAAGGNVTINAAGAGKDSDLLIQGSTVQAGSTISLAADNAVQLLAASNTASTFTSQSNSEGSVGMSFGANGWTANASASKGQGSSNGQDLYYTNTQIMAGDQVNIQSGGDTALRGAVVAGRSVKADVAGDLNIESLQDKSTYAETQSSSGFSISVPIGYAKPSGSLSASSTKISSNYQSANEQSGIETGDGGFQVTVQGNTDLKGGLLAGADQAVAANANSLTTGTLTTSDISNQASATATGSGFTLGTDMLNQGKYGLVKGVLTNTLDSASQSGSSSGQTQAAISLGVVTITDDMKQLERTGKTVSETIASLNRDTSSTNMMAERQDVQAMKQAVIAERAIKNGAVKQLTTLTDESYRVMFKETPRFYKVVCPSEENCTTNPEKAVAYLVKGTPEEIQKEMANASVLAVNGIDNPLDRAAQLAMQNAEPVTNANGEKSKPTSIYLMHYVPASNGLSELLVAGYEKNLASLLGYTNQDLAYAGAIQTRGNDEFVSLGHSRGTLVQTNANTILRDSGFTNANLRVRGVGGAVSVEAYTDAAAKVLGPAGDKDQVTFDYFKNDLIAVSKLTGANAGVWTLSDFWRVLTTNNSMHSCYGTGASGCQQVEILSPNAPAGAMQNNDGLIQYKGGKLVERQQVENSSKQ